MLFNQLKDVKAAFKINGDAPLLFCAVESDVYLLPTKTKNRRSLGSVIQ